jgi:hypothetical protein
MRPVWSSSRPNLISSLYPAAEGSAGPWGNPGKFEFPVHKKGLDLAPASGRCGFSSSTILYQPYFSGTSRKPHNALAVAGLSASFAGIKQAGRI